MPLFPAQTFRTDTEIFQRPELIVRNKKMKVVSLIFYCSVEGGELYDRVVSSKKLEEPFAKFLFYQMLVTVKVRKR
jgi:hypothetical protein